MIFSPVSGRENNPKDINQFHIKLNNLILAFLSPLTLIPHILIKLFSLSFGSFINELKL